MTDKEFQEEYSFTKQFPSLKGKGICYRSYCTHMQKSLCYERFGKEGIQANCIDKQKVRDALDKILGKDVCFCEQLFEGQCDFCTKQQIKKELGI